MYGVLEFLGLLLEHLLHELLGDELPMDEIAVGATRAGTLIEPCAKKIIRIENYCWFCYDFDQILYENRISLSSEMFRSIFLFELTTPSVLEVGDVRELNLDETTYSTKKNWISPSHGSNQSPKQVFWFVLTSIFEFLSDLRRSDRKACAQPRQLRHPSWTERKRFRPCAQNKKKLQNCCKILFKIIN